MGKFLRYILIFSIITVIFFLIGEIIVRNLSSSYGLKNLYIQEKGDKIRTLILGSSHTYYGLNPSEMGDSVFNLANVSQSPEYDLELLKHYKELMPNLKYLIVPISYFTYSDLKMEDDDEWVRVIKYKTRMHLKLHSDFSIYNLEIADFDGYRGQLANLILKKPSNISDSLGFGLGYTLDNRAPNWKETGELRAKNHTADHPGRRNEVLEIQEELIDYARYNGLDIFFITTPTYESYYNNLNPDQEQEMRDAIRELKVKYNIEYLDFLRDERFIDEDFYDPDHLSAIGASKLSKIMKDTLPKINKDSHVIPR